MRIRLLAATAALSAVLAGCGLASDDPAVRAASAQRLDALKAVGVSTLVSLNAAGVDPLALDPNDPGDARKLAIMVSLCGLGTGLTTVYRPDAPELTEAGADVCDLVLQAAQRSVFDVPEVPE